MDHKPEHLYLKVLGNPRNTVDDILFLKTSTDEYRDIYLQAKTLFNLREKIFKKLVGKEIIRSNFDQSGIDDYDENIAERTKLKRQRLHEIERKEQNINNELFKKYFSYQSPSNMYKELVKTENTERNKIKVDLIKDTLNKL